MTGARSGPEFQLPRTRQGGARTLRRAPLEATASVKRVSWSAGFAAFRELRDVGPLSPWLTAALEPRPAHVGKLSRKRQRLDDMPGIRDPIRRALCVSSVNCDHTNFRCRRLAKALQLVDNEFHATSDWGWMGNRDGVKDSERLTAG